MLDKAGGFRPRKRSRTAEPRFPNPASIRLRLASPPSSPTTIVGALVTEGEFKDPYVGMNLRSIPGTLVPNRIRCSRAQPMPLDSPYRVAWWYRTEFATPPGGGGRLMAALRRHQLPRELWLNGTQSRRPRDSRAPIAATSSTSRRRCATTARTRSPSRVFAPEQNDLGINWVDWNPTPPDKDMGLWQPRLPDEQRPGRAAPSLRARAPNAPRYDEARSR